MVCAMALPRTIALLVPLLGQLLTAQVDLPAELAEMVDITDPKARLAAADTFAKRSDVSLENLRSAMQKFGDFKPVEKGRSVERVALWIGTTTEQTELHMYVPPDYDPAKPTPLLLIGHWTGGNGGQALRQWIRFANATGSLLLAPSEAGPNGGWAFSIRERESTLSALRYMRRRFNIDESRIYCTGVSRGGHLTWDLALRYPDLFASIAPMIGGPRIKRVKGQNNIRYIENVVHLPIRDLQGAKDDRYLVANVRLAFERLKVLKAVDAKLLEFPELGHSYDINSIDWTKFFKDHVRHPRPDRVVRLMASIRETRAFWVDILEKDAKKVRVIPQIRQPSNFTKLSETDQRKYVAKAIEKATARLEVRMDRRGRFTAKSKFVKRFRLLLEPDMFEPGKRVLVKHNGRNRRVAVKASKAVLLREFVVRFDRSFLPVAEVIIR